MGECCIRASNISGLLLNKSPVRITRRQPQSLHGSEAQFPTRIHLALTVFGTGMPSSILPNTNREDISILGSWSFRQRKVAAVNKSLEPLACSAGVLILHSDLGPLSNYMLLITWRLCLIQNSCARQSNSLAT